MTWNLKEIDKLIDIAQRVARYNTALETIMNARDKRIIELEKDAEELAARRWLDARCLEGLETGNLASWGITLHRQAERYVFAGHGYESNEGLHFAPSPQELARKLGWKS